MATSDYNQWANARPMLGSLPGHVTGDDQERLGAYQLYDEIYWNVPETFKVVQRGTDDDPIYIPSARMLVEATNRFFGVGFDYRLVGGIDGDRAIVGDAVRTLFKRERFFSKYNSFKRYSLIRGDAVWHILADPAKPAGRRISLHELSPDQFFPIFDVNDVERITGCHIVQIIKDDKGKDIVRRQTYRKTENGTISSELGTFEVDGWDDRNLQQDTDPPPLKPLAVEVPLFELPSQITALPVYHVRNQWQSGQVYGSSDIRSFERVIAAINQGISDEELALALDGLGVYWTTADRPQGGWVLGPGSVIEGEEGEDFQRITGVSTVEPSLSHLNWIMSAMKQASGTPDIAIGNVDVSVAESGISLALQMSPLLARTAEKEAELLAVHDNMMFDLIRMWMPAYEALTQSAQISVDANVGDPMPVDRAAIIKEVSDLIAAQIITPDYGRKIIAERLGYEFPDDMQGQVIANMRALAAATAFDPFEERVRQELSADAGAAGQLSANGSGGSA